MNVVLIAIDTLRADHLGCYGYRRQTSPWTDEIAAQGAVFEKLISPHIPTHPAFTTLFSGRDVFCHQVVAHGGKAEPPAAVRMLAELLAERGVATFAADNLGRWFGRGFQVYEGYSWEKDPAQPWRKGEAVNRAALNVLDQAARCGKPSFTFLHYWDPHSPYLPPPPFDRMFYGEDETDPANRSMEPVLSFGPFENYFKQWMGHVTDIRYPCAQYDAEIAYGDACLRAVYQRLEELGLVEETLLIILGDHGEELDEHDCWFDHHGLYETNLHVPLLLRWPGRIPDGTRVPGMVSMMDIAPTILEALGSGAVAAEVGMTGSSLLPSVETGAGTLEAHYLTESTWMRKEGWRTGRWKLIRALEPDIHDLPGRELYDLEADPGEQNNLFDAAADVARQLEEALDDYKARRLAATGLPDPIATQPISMRRIGSVATAVPEAQRE